MPIVHWPSRLKASAIHLGFSLLVAAAAAALVFALWFPGYLATFAGGQGLFALIVSVDIVVGPLITLIVFDRTKSARELVQDLAAIAFLQLAALAYGLHALYSVRPVVIALEQDRVRIVPAKDVLLSELPQAPADLRFLSLTGPKFVGTAPAARGGKQQSDEIDLALKGYDLGARPKYWRDWESTGRPQALAKSRPIEQLAKRYPERGAELNAALTKTGVPPDQLRFLPIISLQAATAVALVDIRSGDIVGFAPFDGFI